MLDIGWSELLVIAVVAILVVGPKDLPLMLRTVGRYVGTLRKMAGEFRSQFDQAIREAELTDVRETLNSAVKDIQSASPMTDIKKAVDDSAKSIKDIPQAIQGPTPASPTGMPVVTPALQTMATPAPSVVPTSPVAVAPAVPVVAESAAPLAEAEASVAMAETLHASGRSSVAQRAAAAWTKAANDSSGV